MSGDTLFAVAITSTEWRSLLGHGEIRFARRRAQETTCWLLNFLMLGCTMHDVIPLNHPNL
jgi:hypothetical protein